MRSMVFMLALCSVAHAAPLKLQWVSSENIHLADQGGAINHHLDVTITLDEKTLPNDASAASIPVAPGKHRLEVESIDHDAVSVDFQGRVASVTGTPFGFDDSVVNATVSGFFTYDRAVADSVTDPLITS